MAANDETTAVDAEEPSSGWLLTLLAAAAGDPTGSQAAPRLEAAHLVPTDYARFLDDLERDLPYLAPDEPPGDPGELEGWLESVALLDLARRTAARLDATTFPWATRLSETLQHAVSARTATAARTPHGWTCARRAAAELARWGNDAAPWRAIRPLSDTDGFDAPHVDRALALEMWSLGMLHDRDDAALRRLVASPGDWQERYRSLLAHRFDGIGVERRDVALSLEAEPVEAWIRLPHLGRDAGFEVRLTAAGIRSSWPGAPPEMIDPGAREHRLAGDAVTGPLVATIHVTDVSLREQASIAAGVSHDVAEGLAGDRAEALAIALAHWMSSDAPHDALRAAATTYEEGREPTDDELTLVIAFLDLRIGLDRSEAWLGSAAVTAALGDADRALHDCSPALLLLDDDTYDEHTATVIPDAGAWWGVLRALEETVPLGQVTRALADMPQLGDLAPSRGAQRDPVARRGARVIPIRRQRPARPAQIERLAASFRPENLDDPGAEGTIVDTGIAGLELRVRELAPDDASTEHSVVCLRLSLDESSGADLRQVSLRTPGGQPVLPLQVHARPLLWWATVGAAGELVIDLPDLQEQIVVDLGPAAT